MEAYKVTQNIIKLYRNNDKYYNVYYGIVITKLQNICHILEGKSKISTVKIYKLYLQDELCRKQKRKLPNKVFIELLLKSIESRDKKQQIEAIKCMYIYIQNIYSKIYLGLDDFKNDINESLIKNKDIALIGREY